MKSRMLFPRIVSKNCKPELTSVCEFCPRCLSLSTVQISQVPLNLLCHQKVWCLARPRQTGASPGPPSGLKPFTCGPRDPERGATAPWHPHSAKPNREPTNRPSRSSRRQDKPAQPTPAPETRHPEAQSASNASRPSPFPHEGQISEPERADRRARKPQGEGVRVLT